MKAATVALAAGAAIVAGVVLRRVEWVAVGVLSVTIAALVAALAAVERGGRRD